jgi:uncharacterized protein (TIRG00374 family)
MWRKLAKGSLRNKLAALVAVLLFTAVIAVMLTFTDGARLLETLSHFNPLGILLLLLATAISLVLRTFRWKLLLGADGIHLKFSDVGRPLLIGLAASLLTPAKTGDLARCFLLRKEKRIHVKKSLPSLIFERIFDLAVLLALATILLSSLKRTSLTLTLSIMAVVGIVAGLLLIFWFPPLSRLVFHIILRNKFGEMEASARKAPLSPRFYLAMLLSLAIWVIEFSRIYVALQFFGFTSISLLQVSQIMSVSIIAGVVSAIPGGIGSSELTSVALFSVFKVPSYASSAALILDRICGFWLVIGLGAFISPSLLGGEQKRRS